MDTRKLLDEIDQHAIAAGLSVRTICERATGNSRLYERLERRTERDKKTLKRFRDYFAANQPKKEVAAKPAGRVSRGAG